MSCCDIAHSACASVLPNRNIPTIHQTLRKTWYLNEWKHRFGKMYGAQWTSCGTSQSDTLLLRDGMQHWLAQSTRLTKCKHDASLHVHLNSMSPSRGEAAVACCKSGKG